MLDPPLGGLNRRHAYQGQKPWTTPYCNNVWPLDQSNGRGRIGTRPGITSFASSPSGTPYNHCVASWNNSGQKVGVGLTTSNGCFVWNGSAWVEYITTAPGTDFSTPAVLLQTLVMARGGTTALFVDLTGAAGAGTALGSHPGVVGTPPTNCGLACSHGSRLWLGGDTSNQQQLYASRVAEVADFDYGETDPAAAVALAFAEPITAILSHTRDCLLVGMTDSLDVVRGTDTGAMLVETLSHQVGPLMQSAWCHDATGRLWLLTRDGLYTMPPGCGDSVTPVSRDDLPDELLAIDPGVGDKVSVAYDHRWPGIHIYVDYASGTDAHYFCYLESVDSQWRASFWPMTFGSTFRLAFPIKRSMTTAKSSLVALTASSAAYQFDRGSSESVDSFLVYGPIKLSDQGHVGILNDITARLSAGSGDVDYQIYKGHSPEEAHARVVAGTPIAFSGRWTIEGQSYHDHPMVGDECVYIKLLDVSNADWNHEGLDCGIRATRGIVRAG